MDEKYPEQQAGLEGLEPSSPVLAGSDSTGNELLTVAGGTTEVGAVPGRVAADTVLERSSDGTPTVWQAFGGSLWYRDAQGNAKKLRGKWD